MDERIVKKLLVPSFIIVVLSIIFVHELKYLVNVLFFKRKHVLIIGILSAPGNFEQRASIRKTWLQSLSEVPGSSYFLIGNEICEVPPIDRPDPYSCLDMPYILPKNISTESEFTTLKIQNLALAPNSPIAGFIGFGFYIRSDISVKKLGILTKLLEILKCDIQVKLVSAFDNKVLGSVTFSPELLKETNSETLTKQIKPVTLTKGFEAFVITEVKQKNKLLFPSCKFAFWENKPRVINFIHLWQDNSAMPVSFTQKSCTYVFMNYALIGIEKLKYYVDSRPTRLKEWKRFNRQLSSKLKNESNIYNDLMFLDVIDVYRNLSRKMVLFYKRIAETEYFHYVLKADDDSFIDLIRVYQQLQIVNTELDNEIAETVGKNKEIGINTRLRLTKFWWWSYFKEFWKVQHSGKWRDDKYKSASYPTFPCGGGYVVNKGVVDYIVANEINLHYFQGEDVSMGIWLSSLPVIQYSVPKIFYSNSSHEIQKTVISKFKGKKDWLQYKMKAGKNDFAPNSCEWTCNNEKKYNLPLCNKVQLSIQDMYDTWTEYKIKGFL